ncbi:hypothetical protein [Henriciella sp.]|uniref:hypothetical protein n=1 Tax=Henriciella sp. TaxID=1968823 RepID=UPI002615EFA0|nr:hypothetical protein [Henriciella sp.]
MTAARSSLSFDNILSRLANGTREVARWGLRGVIALAVIVMAGMIAVVTAAIGLIIAAVAILLRLTGARNATATRHQRAKTESDGITLDAHRTASGWTVE